MTKLQPQPQHSSEVDLDLLSAYLDNQLAAAERMALERRLQADPHLRAELADLHATVTLLRELSSVPLPRSFTLDATRVSRRQRFGFPLRIWSLGSGFVGLLLLVLASTQLLSPPALSTSSYRPVANATMAVSSFGASETAPQTGTAGGSISSPSYTQATAAASSAFDAASAATAPRQAEAPAAAMPAADQPTAVLPEASASSSSGTIARATPETMGWTGNPAPPSRTFLASLTLVLGGVLGLALIALAAWGLRRG